MTRAILFSDKLKLPDEDVLFSFLQKMVNRRTVGHVRYGLDRSKKYMSRLAEELKTYRKTGNMEQLLNIAVYAYLESVAPENKKFHFDATAESATRKKFGK